MDWLLDWTAETASAKSLSEQILEMKSGNAGVTMEDSPQTEWPGQDLPGRDCLEQLPMETVQSVQQATVWCTRSSTEPDDRRVRYSTKSIGW